MILYDVPDNFLETLKLLSENIKLMGEDTKDSITIYPDYIQKRKNTIASGISIESDRNIYPCAIPDIGCGFHIVRLDGLSKQDFFQNKSTFENITKFMQGNVSGNLIINKTMMRGMLDGGHCFTENLFKNRSSFWYEDEGYLKLDSNHIISKEIFFDKLSMDSFNSFQGHFVELLENPADKEMCVYLFIHSGIDILARRFRDYYYPRMAELSYLNGWSSEEQIIIGQFLVDKEDKVIYTYYNDVKAIINFSFAYRDLLEYNIINVIRKSIDKDFKSIILSDYIHTKLTIDHDRVVHQRGIQHLKEDSNKQYILCGNYGIASALVQCKKSGFFSHGVQTQAELFYNETIINNYDWIIAADMCDVTELQRKRAYLANVCYDFYLSGSLKLVNYIYPFYSYKEEN